MLRNDGVWERQRACEVVVTVRCSRVGVRAEVEAAEEAKGCP
jgi:hypothetical protein